MSTDLFSNPMFIVAEILAVLIAITVHEFSHALVAKFFGDDTAESVGRLSLNPLKHIDPIGTVVLPIILLISGLPPFGWAKPVPVNYSRLRNGRWAMALVAIAGPASNFIMLFGFNLAYKFFFPTLGESNLLVLFFYASVVVNSALMIFNLIPIPPLDGSKVLFALLPDSLNEVKYWLDKYGSFLLIGLILLGSYTSINILGIFFNFGFGILNKIIG